MKKIILYVLIFIVFILLLVFLDAQMRRTAAAELALAESTLSAVSDASAELSELTLTMEKLLVSTSAESSARWLTDVSLLSDRVQRCIAELPDAQGQRAAILSFLSDLSRRSSHLLTALAIGQEITNTDRQQLSSALTDLRLLQSEISLAQYGLIAGEKLDAALPKSEMTERPTALELADYRALPSQEVGSGKALQIAKEFVGVERVTSVSPAPDTAGALPAFGVTVQTADVTLNLEVTRRGGKVLMMVPETASFPMEKSVEACRIAALDFLASRGFGSMEAMYYQVYDGLCVMTCVWVEKGVLIWPDRCVVQVRMDTAEVVGIEARSFWKNHIARNLPVPLLTKEEAAAHLSGDVTVTASRLCLLPHEGQERLCWQFTATRGDDVWIIYVDAITGQELLLEKLMQLEMGSMPA